MSSADTPQIQEDLILKAESQEGFIVDLNSSNGAFVNGQRIQQAQLAGGETILIGSTHLRFDAL